MKQFGFNAVRTSHSPNDPALLRPVRRARPLRGRRGEHRDRTRSSSASATTRDTLNTLVDRGSAHGATRQEPPVASSCGRSATSRATAPRTRRSRHGSAATTRRRPLHYEGAIMCDWDRDADGHRRALPDVSGDRRHRALGRARRRTRSAAHHVRVLARHGQQQRLPRGLLGRDRTPRRPAGRLHLGILGPRPPPDSSPTAPPGPRTAAISATSPTT